MRSARSRRARATEDLAGGVYERTMRKRTSPAGGRDAAATPSGAGGGLDVVTLNIEFGLRIDGARALFARTDRLARANVVLLQEMDPEGTDALAASLGMQYAYYPADVHPRTGRPFGNAVLSRWPIVHDRKIELPHVSFRNPTRRAERVVLGGDLNSHRLGRVVAADAFDWATRTIGPTVGLLFSVDHIFTRGLRASQVGRITGTRGVTDHAAVWARLAWR